MYPHFRRVPNAVVPSFPREPSRPSPPVHLSRLVPLLDRPTARDNRECPKTALRCAPSRVRQDRREAIALWPTLGLACGCSVGIPPAKRAGHRDRAERTLEHSRTNREEHGTRNEGEGKGRARKGTRAEVDPPRSDFLSFFPFCQFPIFPSLPSSSGSGRRGPPTRKNSKLLPKNPPARRRQPVTDLVLRQAVATILGPRNGARK
jgi:hypothetical protein